MGARVRAGPPGPAGEPAEPALAMGHRLDRRTFLVGSLGVAGLLVGCTPGTPEGPAVSATASGSGRTPSASTSPSASARPVGGTVGIAVIGAGGHGRALTRRLCRLADAEIVVVCDPDSARVADLAALVDDRTGTRPDEVADLRRVLDDRRVDAVVIATPHHWHAVAAAWALAAGKHVYLEKPATHHLAESAPLIEAWRRSGLVVEVGTQRRSHPGLQEAIAAVHEGAIGEVGHATCYSWKRRPGIGPTVRGRWPATLDEELWFGPRDVGRPTRQRFHYDWHWFTDFGNGGLGNNGVHRLDVARWGMRLPVTADRTLSWAGRLGPKDSGETPNTALTLLAFGPRSVAHDLRGLPTAPHQRHDPGMRAGDEVAFLGDGAAIIVSRTEGRLVDDRGRVVRTFGADAAEVDPIRRHLAGFLAAVRAGDPGAVAVGLPEGAAAAAMCHAPAAAHAHAGRGAADPDEVAAEVAALAGDAMDAPLASFAAHVTGTGQARDLRFSGTRRVTGGAVVGAPESFAVRTGYELS